MTVSPVAPATALRLAPSRQFHRSMPSAGSPENSSRSFLLGLVPCSCLFLAFAQISAQGHCFAFLPRHELAGSWPSGGTVRSLVVHGRQDCPNYTLVNPCRSSTPVARQSLSSYLGPARCQSEKLVGACGLAPLGTKPRLAPSACFAMAKTLGNSRLPYRRCRSSVVEHSLGKREVVSSILTGSIGDCQSSLDSASVDVQGSLQSVPIGVAHLNGSPKKWQYAVPDQRFSEGDAPGRRFGLAFLLIASWVPFDMP